MEHCDSIKRSQHRFRNVSYSPCHTGSNGYFRQRKQLRKTHSASNLSCLSWHSAYVDKRTICLTLPREIGCRLSSDGRVVEVAKGSPAHASGVIQTGDYLQIYPTNEHHRMGQCSGGGRSYASSSPFEVYVHVTYSTLQPEERPSCPLLVEIGNRSHTSLGIALADGAGNRIRISSMQPGSLADRCGFLRPGDVITHIKIGEKKTLTCSPFYKSQQIAQMIRRLSTELCSIALTIIPFEEDLNVPNQNFAEKLNIQVNGNVGSPLVHYRKTIHQGQTRPHRSRFGEEFHLNEIEEYQKRLTVEDTQAASLMEEIDFSENIISLCLWKDRLYEDWGFSLIDFEEIEDDWKNRIMSSKLQPPPEESNDTQSHLGTFKSSSSRFQGSYVYEIRTGGPACIAGLKEGDKILKINGLNVSQESSTKMVPILASLDDALNLCVWRMQLA